MPKQATPAAPLLKRIQRRNVPNILHNVPTLNLFENIWRTNIVGLLRRPKIRNRKCRSSEVSQLPASGGPITYWNGNSNKWLHRLLRSCFMPVEKGILAAISSGAVCYLESSRRCTEFSRKCTVLYTYHNVPYHTVIYWTVIYYMITVLYRTLWQRTVQYRTAGHKVLGSIPYAWTSDVLRFLSTLNKGGW
jgi:hypothetical protein